MALLLHGLTILFVGLKLTGNIDWSWWLVLLPSYGLFLFVVLLIVLSAFVSAYDDVYRRKRW